MEWNWNVAANSVISEPRAERWYERACDLADREAGADRHGSLSVWRNALDKLPKVPDPTILGVADTVCVAGPQVTVSQTDLRAALMAFHPWRKGPFEILGTRIDTEWRSNLKWDRLAPHVAFDGLRVLDVGCGNGYYGWRMLAAGARSVLGLDPFLLYVMQFEVVRKYAGADCPHVVLPLTDAVLCERLEAFDVTLSMGVLYHRSNPIEHLQMLWHSLRPGGTLVLETIIVDQPGATVLVPEDRYAKMRNVWFLPSLTMLETWLRRTGFHEIRIVDVSRTTSDEQRRTDWMTFESLSDFLDPVDPTRTVEGYPGPVRAIVLADRR